MCLNAFWFDQCTCTFQCLIESCLGDIHLKWCIIYVDDIIVFSKTPKEHIQRLRAMFEKLSAAGLCLKPSKCQFFKSHITLLGHNVSEDGIETDPKKVTAINKWPFPRTVTEVQFLRFYQLLSEVHTKICPHSWAYQSIGVWREC